MVAFLLPSYLIRFGFRDFTISILDVLAIVSIFLMANHISLKNLLQYYKTKNIFILPIGLLIFGLATSLFVNFSAHGLGILITWFAIPILFSFLLTSLSKQHVEKTKLLKTLFYSTAMLSSISIIYKLLGILTYDGRLSSFFESPNHLAMFIAPGIMIGFFFLITRRFNKIEGIFLIPLFLTLYYTNSYTVWLATFVSLIFMLIFAIKTFKFRILFISASIPFMLLILTSQLSSLKLQGLLLNSERSSLQSRIMIWESSKLMLENNPFFGVGPGNFQSTYLAYQKYFPPYLEWAVPHPHNLFLSFYLQSGILGLSGFILLMLALFNKFFRDINKKTAGYLLPAASSIFCILLIGLFDTPVWKNDLAYHFWILFFLIANEDY